MTDDERDNHRNHQLGDTTGRNGVREPSDSGAADQAAALAEIADLVWEVGHGAPPLEKDPVAVMLNLVPLKGVRLDSVRLSKARKRVHVTPTQLAAMLTQRGWQVASRDIFSWEQRSPADVSPALIDALADELHVDVTDLVVKTEPAQTEGWVQQVTEKPKFRELVKRWAVLHAISEVQAAFQLQARMDATVQRGEQPDPTQKLESLAALVAAKERLHQEGQ